MVAHGTDIPDAIKFFYVKLIDIDGILPMVPGNIRSYPFTMLVHQVDSHIFFQFLSNFPQNGIARHLKGRLGRVKYSIIHVHPKTNTCVIV